MTSKFMCGVDYQYELEEGLADLYDSLEELKNSKNCWGTCGIVQIWLDESGNEVSHNWIVKQDMNWSG